MSETRAAASLSVREIVSGYQDASDAYAAGKQHEPMPPELAAAMDAWRPRLEALGPAELPELEAIVREQAHGAAVAEWRAKTIRAAMAEAAFAAAREHDAVAAYVAAFERGEIDRMLALGGEPVQVVLGVYERALDAMDRVPHAWRSREAGDAHSVFVAINALLGERGHDGAVKAPLFARMIAAPGWVGELSLARALCAKVPVPGLWARFAEEPAMRRVSITSIVGRLLPSDVRARGLRLLAGDADALVRREAMFRLRPAEALHWDRLAHDPDVDVRRMALAALDPSDDEVRARIARHEDAAPEIEEAIVQMLAPAFRVPWQPDAAALHAAQWMLLDEGLTAMRAATDVAARRMAAAQVHQAVTSIRARGPAAEETERLAQKLSELERIAPSLRPR